jgi:hypothetical protein
MFGVKVSHNANVKYATTMEASSYVNILRFNDENISNTKENSD